MNNDLNMQLIEQLISADATTASSLTAITQHMHTTFASQLQGYRGTACYTLAGDTYTRSFSYPSEHKVDDFPSDNSDLLTALTANITQIDNATVFIPIQYHDEPYGVYHVDFEDNQIVGQINWTVLQQLLQNQMQPVIQLDESQQEHDTVINTAYDISLAENDTEIIELLFSAVPASIQNIALYRFTAPINMDNPPLSINLRVIADRDKVIRSDETILFTNDAQFTSDLTQRLLDGQFIIEADINNPDDDFPLAFFNPLQSAQMSSCIITGLRVSQQLMGLVVLGSEKITSLSINTYRDFRVLADQIGITFENQRLLRRTEVSLMETQLQYAISNDLVTSKTLPEMLQILLRYFGGDADGAGIVNVEYDAQGLVKDAVVNYQIKSNDTTLYEPHQSLLDYVKLDDLHTLQTAWSLNDIPVYYIEDDKDTHPELPLTVFAGQGIASAIMIPLVEDRLVTHVISINWSEPHTFPDRTRRLLSAVRKQIDIIYQNQQLLEQAQVTSSRLAGQVQTQRALNDLSSFAGTNQDEKLLLDKGTETLKRVLNVDHVGLMLIEEDREWAYLASENPVKATEPVRIPVEEDTWNKIAQGDHYLIEHVDNGQFSKEEASAVKSVGVSSSLVLPFLDLSGELMGSVGLDKYDGVITLTDGQIQTARLINSQIVTQLQNLRLLRDSQQLAGQMQQIARFGETVQSRLDLEEILQTTLHFTKRIIDADYVSIVLYDDKAEKLAINAYHLDGFESVLPQDKPTMSPSDTTVGKVWQTRESLYVTDMKNSEYTNPLSDKIASVYAIALISRGVTRGVLEVGYTSSKPISQIDQSVLVQLANQLAVALENATTYSQSQRLAQNKILANEISLQLQQQMDIDGLLNTTVTELGKALGAKRARIRLGVQQAVKNQ